MIMLNFPNYSFRYRIKKGKAFIFCISRKKFIHLSAEEWVRQHVLHFLIREKKYSLISIKVEPLIMFNGLKKRADLVVFQREGGLILIECKAPHVSLTQKTFDQIIKYNFQLKCPYLMLTNGIQHLFCQINESNGKLYFIKTLPEAQLIL